MTLHRADDCTRRVRTGGGEEPPRRGDVREPPWRGHRTRATRAARTHAIAVELLILLLLTLVNGLFSGAEIAVISMRRTRVEALVEEGSGRARAVQRLRGNPERFLATVQIGITVIGATAAAFGGASVAGRVGPAIARVPLLQPYAEELALGIVVVGVSFLSLVLGELVPKSLALRQAEPYALLIARPFEGLAWLARPAVWVLTGASNLVLRLFGDRTSFTEARHSRDELVQLVDEAASAGTVEPEAGQIASRALDLEEIDAEDIMVPRHRIDALPATVSAEQVYALAADAGHTRMLVHQGDLDHLVGVVHLRDALVAARSQDPVDLTAIARTVPYVAEWTSGTQLLRTLQRTRSQLAVVVDEHGTTRGLVTLEDLFEELVGEIADEPDEARPLFTLEEGGVVRVDAAMPVHELARELDVELPEGEGYATMAGLALYLAGRIPAVGERFPLEGGLTLEIVEASPRRVRVVRLHRPASLEPPPEA